MKKVIYWIVKVICLAVVLSINLTFLLALAAWLLLAAVVVLCMYFLMFPISVASIFIVYVNDTAKKIIEGVK